MNSNANPNSRKMESKTIIVSNAKVRWAKVQKPEDAFGKDQWSIDVYPSAADAEKLRGAGLQLKDGEGGPFITAKRNAKSKKGNDISPPRVVDADKRPFGGLIGNGSTCNVIISVYPWTFGTRKGMGAWLEAVQVVDLVQYSPKDSVDFDVEDSPQPIGGGDDSLPF